MIRRIDQKKERRKKFWMGAVLVFLMVFSMAGIIIGNQSADVWEYNGYKFKLNEDFYVTKINGEKKGFSFLPQELLSLNTSPEFSSKVSAPMVYFTFNPEEESNYLIYIDVIRRDLEENLGGVVANGKTKESTNYVLPTITCENSTQFTPVFFFNISAERSINEYVNGCVVFNGVNQDFLRFRDLIMYKKYGVMDE